MLKIDDDPLKVLAALLSIETQDAPFPHRTWGAVEESYRHALLMLLNDQQGAEAHSLVAAQSYWEQHRDDDNFKPFVVYGANGMNRYFVLRSGEVVLSQNHLPRGNTELRELYVKQAELIGVRVQ